MAVTKESIDIAIKTTVETLTDFFKDVLRPNMELEDIKQITFPRFHSLIKKYEEDGMEYGGGKFYVKYLDEKSFKLEFEMYFRDAEGAWHKVANESEPRDISLLENSLIRTMSSLKVVEFPIDTPPSEKTVKALEQIAPPASLPEVSDAKS